MRSGSPIVDLWQLTNDTGWLSSALESFKEMCIQELSRNDSLPGAVAEEIIGLTCPNECNAPNGNCIKGRLNAENLKVVLSSASAH